MAFEVLTGIYRTDEANGTYKSAVCLTFVGDDIWVHGLTGRLSASCTREIYDFAKSTGKKNIKYIRRRNGNVKIKSFPLESLNNDHTIDTERVPTNSK